MTSINNFNFNNLKLRLVYDEYWDMEISSDETYLTPSSTILSGSSLGAYIDFGSSASYSTGSTSADTVYSLVSWDGAYNSGATLNDIGLTGYDNGLLTYVKASGDTGNTVLVSGITGSTLTIPSGDTRLKMTRVTGSTTLFSGLSGTTGYTYPISIVPAQPFVNDIGQYAQFCGGFYQGYYKLDNFDYQTLPSRVPKSWTAEFWLNKSSCTGVTGTTLNDTHPDNKGFIFYLGTRAENKYWNKFDGLNTGSTSGCTSGATEFCTIPKEDTLTTSTGWPVSPNNLFTREITNKFLIYNRTKTGQIASRFTGDSITVTAATKAIDSTNKFLDYNRTATGKTISDCGCSGSGSGSTGSSSSTSAVTIDYLSDLKDNAFGIRIKDDGSIGYRSLAMSSFCSGGTYTTGLTMEEQYSVSGLVPDNQWCHIAVKMEFPNTITGCGLITASARTGTLYVYADGKLKSKLTNVSEVVGKRLAENFQKQETVPYNISLGGGSQGLLESMTLDGQDPSDSDLPIETYFAGSFVGGISKFRFYVDNLTYCQIRGNFEVEAPQYAKAIRPNQVYTNFISRQINHDFLVLQQNGYGLIWLP